MGAGYDGGWRAEGDSGDAGTVLCCEKEWISIQFVPANFEVMHLPCAFQKTSIPSGGKRTTPRARPDRPSGHEPSPRLSRRRGECTRPNPSRRLTEEIAREELFLHGYFHPPEPLNNFLSFPPFQVPSRVWALVDVFCAEALGWMAWRA
jgi:hypothetical protein